MRLRDIMSEAVERIHADASVDDARELMRRQDVRHLVVVEADAIVGVLSEHDMRAAARDTTVRALMSAPAVTATPETTVRQAANLLRGNHISCLPILDPRQRLIGMVTTSDLLDLVGKGVTREQIDDARHKSWVPGR